MLQSYAIWSKKMQGQHIKGCSTRGLMDHGGLVDDMVIKSKEKKGHLNHFQEFSTYFRSTT